MRLNQLAKKVGKPYTRVEKYIRKDLNIEGIEGPNSRVGEDVVEKVISKFGLASDDISEKPKVKLETVEAVPAEISPEERGLEDIELKFATPAESVIPNLDGLGETKTDLEEVEKTASEEQVNQNLEEVIKLDEVKEGVQLVGDLTEIPKEKVISETVETEETVLHLDEEGTIIAPKVELEGFTVRGKIEIPGVTDKPEEQVVELTIEELAELKEKKELELKAQEEAAELRRRKIDSDAAKAAAFKAKKEKENKAILRKKIEEEKKLKKEEGKKHYLDNVKHAPKVSKIKGQKKKERAEKVVEDNKAFENKEKYDKDENLTSWQKLMRWFNT